MSTQIASKRKREEKWKEMEKMFDNARLRLHTKRREKTETHMIRKNKVFLLCKKHIPPSSKNFNQLMDTP
jgi:hypothetical protein